MKRGRGDRRARGHGLRPSCQLEGFGARGPCQVHILPLQTCIDFFTHHRYPPTTLLRSVWVWVARSSAWGRWPWWGVGEMVCLGEKRLPHLIAIVWYVCGVL